MTTVTPVVPQTTFNVDSVVRFLNHRFKTATAAFPRDNSRKSHLGKLQIEFAHLIDEIQRGPTYQIGKAIADANTFITNIKLPA